MNTAHGFSLTEVLVSLLLMTSTSLALLKQQWQISQLLNQSQLRNQALTQLDNACERSLAGNDVGTTAPPFKIKKTEANQTVDLQITWKALDKRTTCCQVPRQLVIFL